ncbi:AMP-binding protein [Streptomyces tricolor]|nr:AMP-binding protein [Streptomyces tricolor]
MYLLHGQGTTLIDLHHDGAGDLAEQITAARPRTVCLTPSLLATCTEALDGVQTLVLAGEPCPPGLVRRLPDGPRVLNVYGPTETTIAATWADSARGDDVTTIGRPLPGYHVHVLAEDGSPTPPGQVGELTGGAGRGPRLPQPAGPHRAVLRRRPVRRPRGADVPHGRPGEPARGRATAPRGTGRRADQGTRLPVELPEVEWTAGELPGCAPAPPSAPPRATLGRPSWAVGDGRTDWPARHRPLRRPAPCPRGPGGR